MRHKTIGAVVWLIFLYSLIHLQSCSSKHNHILRSEISGKGLLTLDLSNPYLAPNKFLSEEAKTSETLKGFLSLKGAPELLEFSDPLIGLPSLKLVYKGKNEVYVLEERGQEWIIQGPSVYEEKIDSDTSENKKTIFETNTTPALLPSEQNKITNDLAASSPTTKTHEANEEKNTLDDAMQQRPSFKDVYHEVSFPGQTISFVTYWYTGNIMNSDRVRRINSSLKESLKNGDIVRIPSYIAQNDSAPTPEDLQKFNSGVLDKTKVIPK